MGDVPSMDDLEPMMRRALEALDTLAKEVSDGAATPSHLVDLSEAVSKARAVLYVELARQGWVPPPGVTSGAELDDRLTHEGLGGGYDNPAPPSASGGHALDSDGPAP